MRPRLMLGGSRSGDAFSLTSKSARLRASIVLTRQLLVELSRSAASASFIKYGRPQIRCISHGGRRHVVAIRGLGHGQSSRASLTNARRRSSDVSAMRNQQRSPTVFLPSTSARKAFGKAGGAQEIERVTHEVGGMAEEFAKRDGAKGGSIATCSGHAVSIIRQQRINY